MLPFLAPLRKPDVVFRIEPRPNSRISIEFHRDSPANSRVSSVIDNREDADDLELTARDRNFSGSVASETRPVPAKSGRASNVSGSGSSEGRALSVSSRSNSRQTNKSPNLQRPTSARSAKSSPLPPPVPSETPPSIQRHRNKGLETSSAMLELFGGGGSNASSAFQRIPPKAVEQNFHRKSGVEKELQTQTRNPVKPAPANLRSLFDPVDPHTQAYARVTKKTKTSTSQFDQVAQPGPEWFEGFEKMNMTGIELPPDPDCPAERVVNPMFEAHKDSPESNGSGEGWSDAKENVLQASGSPSSAKKDLLSQPSVEKDLLSQPGPDLGDDEEEDSTGVVTEIEQPRRNSGELDARDAEDATGSEQGEQAEALAAGSGMSLLIRNAQIVNDDSVFSADVLIQDGVIKQVGSSIEVGPDAQVVDAEGKMLLPAGIDVHTHFSAPESADDITNGCRAALAGGTATVVEMISPRSGETVLSAFARVRQTLDSGALCNVALSAVIRQWNDAMKKELEKLVADGVNSFVLDIEGDEKIYQAMEACRSMGAHVRILPENRTIVPFLEKRMLEMGISGPEGFLQSRPEELETERVSNICVLSQLTSCPVSILSVSSGESVGAIDRGRGSGALAHTEVAAAAVVSDASHYFNKCLKHASAHLTEVPLRTDASNKLLAALASQPLAVCTSGHRAVSSGTRTANKDFVAMPKGTSGAEERMAVVWEKAVRTGRMDPMRFVAVTSTNAAKIFNLYPRKGRIAVGADADLVLWDATTKQQLGATNGQSKADVSVYEGFTVHAKALATIVCGRVAWKDGAVKDAKGSYLALQPHSPYLFSVVQQRSKVSTAEKVVRETPTTNGDAHVTRPARKSHLDSNIDFAGDSRPAVSRTRNPPGGRSSGGFW